MVLGLYPVDHYVIARVPTGTKCSAGFGGTDVCLGVFHTRRKHHRLTDDRGHFFKGLDLIGDFFVLGQFLLAGQNRAGAEKRTREISEKSLLFHNADAFLVKIFPFALTGFDREE